MFFGVGGEWRVMRWKGGDEWIWYDMMVTFEWSWTWQVFFGLWDGVFPSGQPRGGVQGGVNCSCACRREGGPNFVRVSSFWGHKTYKFHQIQSSMFSWSFMGFLFQLQQPFTVYIWCVQTCSSITFHLDCFFCSIWLLGWVWLGLVGFGLCWVCLVVWIGWDLRNKKSK